MAVEDDRDTAATSQDIPAPRLPIAREHPRLPWGAGPAGDVAEAPNEDRSRDEPGLSDRDLVRAHLAGDAGAFTELVRRHRDRLWRTALAMLRDRDDAADAVQDALLRAFRSAHTFRGDAQVMTWLHSIVMRTALDRITQRRRAIVDPLETVTPRALSAPNGPADRADEAVIEAVIAALPRDQRDCFVRIDLLSFTYAEVALELGISEGTVRSRRARGKARLVAALRDAGLVGPNRLPAKSHRQAAEVSADDRGGRGPGARPPDTAGDRPP